MNHSAYAQMKERIHLAKDMISCCRLCPHECRVDRTRGEKGICGLGESVICFREMIHNDEENGLNPSHQIYFAGCNLKCEICSVAEWNENLNDIKGIDKDTLLKTIAKRKSEGAKTLNLLGGEPAVNLPAILEILDSVDSSTTVIWNSNMYYNLFVDEMINGLAEVFLADLKCGNSKCSELLLGVSDYTEIAKRNILKAIEHADVIIRHLVLPGHSDCCMKPVFQWIADQIPQAKLSIRFDYIPPADAAYAPKKYLNNDEINEAKVFARKLGLNLI